jgi:methylamine---glutamate N-methyltransferase subunit B
MDQLAKSQTGVEKVDLAKTPLRELNQALHALKAGTNATSWEVVNPKG